MSATKKRIAFIVPYPFGLAPGPRFRFEQYLDVLEENGFHYRFFPFFGRKTYLNLYKNTGILAKALQTLKGYVLRIWQVLFIFWQYEFIFIYREATPLGFPFVEWILKNIFGKKIIYDFDDAIWISTASAQHAWIEWLKYSQKVPKICRWAYKVSVGNDYLAENAQKFGARQVVHNPTTLDTEKHHNGRKNHAEKPLVIGWTGSHSTLPYLEPLVSILRKLEGQFDFEFHVICNQEPEFSLRSLVFVPWRKETEIEDLLRFHIGVMPLPNDRWAKGKCGFKALQYMSLGIPAVASPVGVNSKIIEEGKSGYLVERPEEWEEKLKDLLQNETLRVALGKKGQQTVAQSYSVRSNRANFLNLFKD